MSEVYEHNPGDHEDPLPGPTWIIGMLGVVLLAVIGMGLTALLYNAQSEEEVRKVFERDPASLVEYRESQHAKLSAAPHWQKTLDADGRDHQALIIPITTAMEQTIREHGSRQPEDR